MTQYNITMSSQSSSITPPLHMTESAAFNLYVRESMLPSNKENCWIVAYDDMKIPVVIVMKDSEFMNKLRREARRSGHSQFRCNQCANNCDKLVSVIGKSKHILCAHTENNTHYTRELSSIANRVYQHAAVNQNSYSLQIATDKLLLKDKHAFVNQNNPPEDASRIYLHYAGNCDTIDIELQYLSPSQSKEHTSRETRLNILNKALDQYWIHMLTLLSNLSENWNLAGKRHATLQRIRTIQELSREVTYAEAHFDKTLQWILDVLGGFTRPLSTKYYTMEIIVGHVANAIASGRIKYSDENGNSVVHIQYSQMKNTIMMWMEKAVSREALKKMMTKLCGPTKGQRTKEVSVQHIESTERMIGTNFWTRVATTKTLLDFYGDDKESKFFWVSPHIHQSKISCGSSGFAAIKAKAKNAQSSSDRVCHWDTPSGNAESIPELIKVLISGDPIYIRCNDKEHAILAHTSIDTQHMACVPVKGKGALMWTFMGGTGFGIHKSGHTKWRRLIAIHHIKVGAFSNYILVCDTSRQLAPYVKNNPVMGDWTLSANAKRHMGPVFSKLKTTTRLSVNTPMGYAAGNEYPIIGVGVCKGTNGLLAYGHTISYKVVRHSRVSEEKTIKYYESMKSLDSGIPHPPGGCAQVAERSDGHFNKAAKFCSNCAAPRATKPKPQSFCSNCGSSF
jgi:hypothetical protein